MAPEPTQVDLLFNSWRLCNDRRLFGQSALVSGTHLGSITWFLLLWDSFEFADVVRPLWLEDWSGQIFFPLITSGADLQKTAFTAPPLLWAWVVWLTAAVGLLAYWLFPSNGFICRSMLGTEIAIREIEHIELLFRKVACPAYLSHSRDILDRG
jgi:hypothetical protein